MKFSGSVVKLYHSQNYSLIVTEYHPYPNLKGAIFEFGKSPSLIYLLVNCSDDHCCTKI